MTAGGAAAQIIGLSKSRLTSFEQCPKRLWLSVHRKNLYQEAVSRQIAAGHEAGKIACDLVPGGVMIEPPRDLTAALQKTSDLLASGHRGPIYEGTFVWNGVLIQVDILEPTDDGPWKLAEVKSSTKLKPYHINDVATQAWVLQGIGFPVASFAVRLINPEFVLTRPGHYQGLFVDAPVDEAITPVVTARGHVVEQARVMLAGDEPEREMGDHCANPLPCQYKGYCAANLEPGPQWPISLLPNTGNRLAAEWAEHGKACLTELVEEDLDKPQHRLIHRATTSGLPFHDAAAIRLATGDWSYPRHFLDFETIAFSVPRWVGTKPNQPIPFQFSCHVQYSDGTVKHAEFLQETMEDPRRACAQALVEVMRATNQKGAVIAFSKSVERKAILAFATACPDLEDELNAIAGRLVDLLPVVRAGFCHRDQRGSWSIKKVLECVFPALAYSNLAISDGMAAQDEWVSALSDKTSTHDRQRVFSELREYCGRDTEAMLKLLERLVSDIPVN